MGRKIICPECNTFFDETVLKQKNSEDTCLVCGASLSDDGVSDHKESPKEKKIYYYYDDGTLDDMLFDGFTPLYTFEAVDIKDAERQLKEVCPNSPLFRGNSSPGLRCPRCFSTEFQFVPRKWSLISGFATNRVDRMCNHCGKRF